MQSTEIARLARIAALQMVHRAGAAHIGSALSSIDILSVLYSGATNIDPNRVEDPMRDVIVMSKGHAAAGLYAVLAVTQFFPEEWLDRYCQNGFQLNGHVTSHDVPGVEFSTGSLGHGLPFGVGVALAQRMASQNRRVYVVMSDGECDEGSNWEAFLIAAHFQLSNLTVLIDRNGLQSLRSTEETIRLEPLAAKFESFGWECRSIDGHSHQDLKAAITSSVSVPPKPRVVICNTVKGKGVTFMEEKVEWHYKSPNDEQLSDAIRLLGGEK